MVEMRDDVDRVAGIQRESKDIGRPGVFRPLYWDKINHTARFPPEISEMKNILKLNFYFKLRNFIAKTTDFN